MTSAQAETEFRTWIEGQTPGLQTLTPVQAAELMMAFYRDRRVTDCDVANEGDMLLFQWGVYPWGGESFRISITRQFILRGEDADDFSFFQLCLTVHYPPDDESRASSQAAQQNRTSNHWCSNPEELPELRQFIATCPALALATARVPAHVTLEYQRAD